MTIFLRGILIFLFCCIFLQARDLRPYTLVVYNENDPESQALAREYALLREISSEKVFGIRCSTNEEISRREYQETIENPLQEFLKQKKWIQRYADQEKIGEQILEIQRAVKNDVWVIVLMRGIPLKIAHDPTLMDSPTMRAEFQSNAAAVDSELAMLPTIGLPKVGPLRNLFFERARTGGFDLLDSDQLIMVGRLDGPSPQIVRRMMREAYETEQKQLRGKVAIDLRGIHDPSDHYSVGDVWLKQATESFRKAGWWVEVDEQANLFPSWLPWGQMAFYFGWYTGTAEGPFMRKGSSVFQPGAIAYHIHSASAATVRSTSQYWVGPLLDRGATATMGAVYEPYLELTPHIDRFVKELLEGRTFIEAGYASQRGLSWMVTFVGDPLYRPFVRSFQEELKNKREGGASPVLPSLELQQFLIDFPNAEKVSEKEILSMLERCREDPLSLEIFGDYLWAARTQKQKQEKSLECYQKAYPKLTDSFDCIRVAGKQAKCLAEMNRWQDVYAVLTSLSRNHSASFLSAGGVVLLKRLSSMPDAPPLPSELLPYLKQETGGLYEW